VEIEMNDLKIQKDMDEFDQFLKEEEEKLSPSELIKQVFSEKVMGAISKNHHKSKDGGLYIYYDYWNDMWSVDHPGYIRTAEGTGKTYEEAASNFLSNIKRENDVILFRELEDAINEQLPKDISVTLGENSISVYQYENGVDSCKYVTSYDGEMSIEDIVEKMRKLCTNCNF